MKKKSIPPPKNTRGYTVKEACGILHLNHARVSMLFKKCGVAKIKNRYFATPETVVSLINREERSIKEYDLL